ncbi:DUF4296 domain-containing protein [Fodinibius salsisoli]|uniref:DUF4296 domain-containing protein n=1 Tax=Fodinibius salsisoli TaxID=2820877 RepID=A0ABT3PSQ9_9BACT|nr:DUF4296 domain-containing protein [Fodinibius salsisoli]MCW9708894.1 DUF4296 domain-containing protein [Fodinibius salsisoli]
MSSKMRSSVGLLFLLCALVGCMTSPEEPDNLIPEDQYISLLVEFQLVRTYQETGRIDSLATDSLRKRIFQHYNISPTAFQSSHTYYQQFPGEQKKRIDKAIEELRMDRVADSIRTRRRAPLPPNN